MKEFKTYDIILCQTEKGFELGVVDQLVKGKSFEEGVIVPRYYRVWYENTHKTVVTSEKVMFEIENLRHFFIIRKSKEDAIQDNPIRMLACEILDFMDGLVDGVCGEPLFNNYAYPKDVEEPDDTDENGDDIPYEEGLIGGSYYDFEDKLTAFLLKRGK